MNYYLLVYDRRQGEILDRREYSSGEQDRALADRLTLMLAKRAEPEVEVVLLGAESYEDLVRTHSRYFKSAEEILSTARSRGS